MWFLEVYDEVFGMKTDRKNKTWWWNVDLKGVMT